MQNKGESALLKRIFFCVYHSLSRCMFFVCAKVFLCIFQWELIEIYLNIRSEQIKTCEINFLSANERNSHINGNISLMWILRTDKFNFALSADDRSEKISFFLPETLESNQFEKPINFICWRAHITSNIEIQYLSHHSSFYFAFKNFQTRSCFAILPNTLWNPIALMLFDYWNRLTSIKTKRTHIKRFVFID